MDKKRKAISLSLFLIALLPRLIIGICSLEAPSHDAYGYDHRAVALLSRGEYSDNTTPTAFKEPFYSFFLAGIYSVFGHRYLVVRIIQAVLGALVCVFVFFTGERLFSRKIGLVAGIISAANPSFILATEHLVTETLFTFILMLVVIYSIRLSEKPNKYIAIILGILLGIGSLTRSVLFPFGILLGSLIFLFLRKNYQFKKTAITVSLIFICFFFTILPWTLRNWNRFHKIVPISTNVGINIYSSYFPPEGKLFGFTASDKNTEYAMSLKSESEASTYLLKKTGEEVGKMGMLKFLKLELLKVLYFWCPFDWEIIGGGRYNFIYGFILPFFIFGFLSTLKKFNEFIFVYLPVIYFFFISLVTYGSPRFRLPIEPYLILIASAGLVYFIINRPWAKIFPVALASGYLLLNLFFYLHAQQVKTIVRAFFEKINLW